jgi:Holliday junction resolvase RusA-like endonuclease
MKLTIEMPWEKNLSVNHMRFGRKGGYRKKPEVQAWMHSLGYRVKAEVIGVSFSIPVRVTVDFRWPDKRRHDTHNYFKAICDAVAAGLGIDDKDIRISTGEVEIDRENPGFTITIEEGS